MKFLVRKELGGHLRVLQARPGEACEGVAAFDNSKPGLMAYAGFVGWVAQAGYSLFDEDRGEYVAGCLGQLVDGVG